MGAVAAARVTDAELQVLLGVAMLSTGDTVAARRNVKVSRR
jgi:hypothetical protein